MPFFTDNFTDTDTTLLHNHVPDVGTSWTRLWASDANTDFVINASNQCKGDNDVNDGVMYTADASYPSADYDITMTMVTNAATNTSPLFMLVRVQNQENMYAVAIENEPSESSLYKKVTGTWTPLGVAFSKPANGSVCKLEIIGSTLKFYDDGVEIATATDSDITAAGKAGIAGGGGAELLVTTDDLRAHVIDTLSVNDLGTPGGDPEGSLLGGKLIFGGLLQHGVLVRG